MPELPITEGVLTAEEIRRYIGRNDPVIIEVGANCAQTTAQLLAAMPGAKIYAFEPEPRAIEKFRRNIQSPNVRLFETAVGALNGSITFNQSSGNEQDPEYRKGWDQSGSIRPPKSHLKVWPWVRFQTQITVPITTLDAWSKQHQVDRCDFIWADVQGAESDLIDGASSFLRASRFFYTEYSNEEWYEGQITLAQIQQKLPDFRLTRRYAMDALFENQLLRPKAEPKLQISYPTIKL